MCTVICVPCSDVCVLSSVFPVVMSVYTVICVPCSDVCVLSSVFPVVMYVYCHLCSL